MKSKCISIYCVGNKRMKWITKIIKLISTPIHHMKNAAHRVNSITYTYLYLFTKTIRSTRRQTCTFVYCKTRYETNRKIVKHVFKSGYSWCKKNHWNFINQFSLVCNWTIGRHHLIRREWNIKQEKN